MLPTFTKNEFKTKVFLFFLAQCYTKISHRHIAIWKSYIENLCTRMQKCEVHTHKNYLHTYFIQYTYTSYIRFNTVYVGAAHALWDGMIDYILDCTQRNIYIINIHGKVYICIYIYIYIRKTFKMIHFFL